MKNRQVDGLIIKSGPTESGELPPPTTPPPSYPVGGEMLPVDKLSVFLSNFWFILILLLFLPLALIFYKRRNMALRFFTPLVSRFFEYRRLL